MIKIEDLPIGHRVYLKKDLIPEERYGQNIYVSKMDYLKTEGGISEGMSRLRYELKVLRHKSIFHYVGSHSRNDRLGKKL